MGVLSEWRDKYVIWHANQFVVPVFAEGEVLREQLLFSGRVQKVGFRLEIETLANRLGLVGFAQNLPDGRVFAEVQGTTEQIEYLISCMKALKRAKVVQVERKIVDVVESDLKFVSRF